MPAITVSAKISRQPMVYDGKTYQVQSTAPTAMTNQITDGITTAGDVLKYEFALKPYGAIEITIELKVKAIGEDIYQAIIIRMERGIGPNGSIRLPIIVQDPGRAEISSNEPYYAIIGGIWLLALGGAATSGYKLVAEGIKVIQALRTLFV